MRVRLLREGFHTVFGTLLLAFGTAVFLLPCELVSGGVAGLSVLLGRVFPSVPPAALVFFLTWGLFALGWVFLGHRFAARTLLSAVLYPAGVALFSRLVEQVTAPPALLSALLGGLLVGGGCALAFRGGGSTGGVDALAFVLCRFFPTWRPSAVIFGIDAVTILVGLPLVGDLSASLLGIASAAVSSLVVERLYEE